MGHPRKSFGRLNFCSSFQNITCWAPNFLAFALLDSLKYLLGNSIDLSVWCKIDFFSLVLNLNFLCFSGSLDDRLNKGLNLPRGGTNNFE